MRTPEEYEQTARQRQPFANSTEWEIWNVNVCNGGGSDERRCVNDDDENSPCSLITLGIVGKTPAEWIGPHGRYACSEKVTPADARRIAREAQGAAERAALEAAHYPMFPAKEVP